MGHPIVFISHFTIKAGKLDNLQLLAQEVAARLDAEKPQTLVYLDYLNDHGTQATFVHVFADPDAMDLHIEGADERSRLALEFMDPDGWEIYGQASDAALALVRGMAASAQVPLIIQSAFLAGFVRPNAGD